LPTNFFKITEVTINELMDKIVFPNIPQNCRNRQWLSPQLILAADSYEVNTKEINIIIVNEISSDTTTYLSVDIVMNQDQVVNFQPNA